MSLLKSVQYSKSGRVFNIDFPTKKSLILRGRNKDVVLYIVESLLASDFTGYNFKLDKEVGVEYDFEPEKAVLSFADGGIMGENHQVDISGNIPKIHCIRCLGLSTEFRSFFVSDKLSHFESIYSNMTHYSGVIDDSKWVRIIESTNDLLGFKFVDFNNRDLKFNPLDNYAISIEGQQLIYLLIAECYLTPEGYHRVLLLSDIKCLNVDIQLKLLELLDNIKGHTLLLSGVVAAPVDLSPASVLKFLNV